MKYLTPDEIKNNSKQIKSGFLRQAINRPLSLKGECLGIFSRNVKELRKEELKVLDFGTGSGGFLKGLNAMGYSRLYGCDIGDFVVDDIKPDLTDFRTFDASFEKFPYKDEWFDAITAWEVFEHLENPHHAIREMHRILKPSGLLFVSMPNLFHLISRLVFLKSGLFPKWHEKNNHISLFPRGVFEKTFLRLFDLQEEGYSYPTILGFPRLQKISQHLPANKWFGNWVYYVLRKKTV